MDFMSEWNTTRQEFLRFRAVVDRALSLTSDPAEMQHLSELARFLDQSFAEAEQSLAPGLAEIEQQVAQARATILTTRLDLEKLRQELANPPAPPAPPAEPALDPLLGGQLRDEILAQFGSPTRQAARPTTLGDVGEMSSQAWRPAEHGPRGGANPPPPPPPSRRPSPPPKPPAPPRKPTPRPGSSGDAADLNSGDWNP
jgi:hypothetical protein